MFIYVKWSVRNLLISFSLDAVGMCLKASLAASGACVGSITDGVKALFGYVGY